MYDIALFIIFVAVFFAIPGSLLLQWAGEKKCTLSHIVLSLVVGAAGFIVSALLVRFLPLPIWVLYLYPASLLFLARPKVNLRAARDILIQIAHDAFYFVFAAMVTLLTVMLSAVHFGSGFVSGGFAASAARDSFWRLSIIAELLHRFPPQIPGFPPVALKNYHFLYDFFTASVHMLTGIEVARLYFLFLTVFSAGLFVLTVYLAIRIFVANRWTAVFGTVLGVLSGNMSYLLPLISDQYTFFAQSNIFMSDQPFDQAHNPFNLFAYALFLAAAVLFHRWSRQKRWQLFVLLSIVVGILPGVKVYAGAVGGLALGVGVLYIFITDRKFYPITILPALVALPIFALMRGDEFSILRFSPLWLLDKMIQDHDRLNLPDMVLRQQHYQQTGNFLRLIQLRAEQLTLYLVGNLNVRIFAIGLLWSRMRSHVRRGVSAVWVFLTAALVFAFLLPLTVSQTRGVYDSIQFAPYGLVVAGIFAAVVFDRGIVAIWKRAGIRAAIVVGVVLLLVAVPTNMSVFTARWRNEKEQISSQEVAALQALRAMSSPADIVLTDTAEQKLRLMYVPALSQRRVFLSGTALTQQLGTETASRQQAVEHFFASGDRDFLRQNNISYIYLSNTPDRYAALMQQLQLPLVWKDRQVAIYTVE